MNYRLLVIVLACLFVTGCTSAVKFSENTGFSMWNTYVDDLGTGSSVSPGTSIITKDGNAEIMLVKAADAERTNKYPYAGVFFDFNRSGNPVDLSGYSRILLTYKLSGQISLLLSQPDIPPGEEYRVELTDTETYKEVNLDWEDFTQPEWVRNPKPLNQKNITGVKFQITSSEKTSTLIGINSFKLQ